MVSSRIREYVIAASSVMAVLVLVVAPVWVIELAVAGMAASTLYWVMTCPIGQISLANGMPRPLVFVALLVGMGVHLSAVRFLGDLTANRLTLTLSLLLLAGAFLGGLKRVLWQPTRTPPGTSAE